LAPSAVASLPPQLTTRAHAVGSGDAETISRTEEFVLQGCRMATPSDAEWRSVANYTDQNVVIPKPSGRHGNDELQGWLRASPLRAPRGLRLINDRDGHAAVLAHFDTALNE